MIANPNDILAAAAVAALFQNGVAMRQHKHDASPPPPAQPAATVPVGITGAQYLIGMMMLTLALLGAAMIVHHGLTA
jgi:hypothetical protein